MTTYYIRKKDCKDNGLSYEIKGGAYNGNLVIDLDKKLVVNGSQFIAGFNICNVDQVVIGDQEVDGYQEVKGSQDIKGRQKIGGHQEIMGFQFIDGHQKVGGYQCIHGCQTVDKDQSIGGCQEIESVQIIGGDQTICGYQHIEDFQSINGSQEVKGSQTIEGYQKINETQKVSGCQSVFSKVLAGHCEELVVFTKQAITIGDTTKSTEGWDDFYNKLEKKDFTIEENQTYKAFLMAKAAQSIDKGLADYAILDPSKMEKIPF